jgi:hypothetical protein
MAALFARLGLSATFLGSHEHGSDSSASHRGVNTVSAGTVLLTASDLVKVLSAQQKP